MDNLIISDQFQNKEYRFPIITVKNIWSEIFLLSVKVQAADHVYSAYVLKPWSNIGKRNILQDIQEREIN